MDALFLLLLVLAEVCRITCPAYSLVLCICMVYTVRLKMSSFSGMVITLLIGICSVVFFWIATGFGFGFPISTHGCVLSGGPDATALRWTCLLHRWPVHDPHAAQICGLPGQVVTVGFYGL